MATWIIGDVHGMYDMFQNLIKSPEIKEEDTVILIGDIIDRGKKAYKMLKWAMENITPDGKYQMILGNHEDNIIQDYKDKIEGRYSCYTDDNDISVLDCHYHFDTYMYAEGFETVKSVKPFIEWFETLPLYKKVTVTKPDGRKQEYIIAHGWYTAKEYERDTFLWHRDVEDLYSAYPKSVSPEDILSGNFIPDGFTEDFNSEKYGGAVLIHGHTPVFQENGYPCNAMVYKRKNSINIDSGACFRGGKMSAIRLEDEMVLYANRCGEVVKGNIYLEEDYKKWIQLTYRERQEREKQEEER